MGERDEGAYIVCRTSYIVCRERLGGVCRMSYIVYRERGKCVGAGLAPARNRETREEGRGEMRDEKSGSR